MPGADATLDLTELRSAVAAAGARTARLVAGAAGDGDRPVPGMDWTAADVAAHLASGCDAYAAYLTGDVAPRVDVTDLAGGSLAASNAANLEAEAERDLAVLGRRIEEGVGRVLDLVAAVPPGEPVAWHGREVTPATFLAAMLGELVLHGRDVALALGRRWAIAADDARMVALGMAPVLDIALNPAAAAGVRVTYDVHLRGGGRVTLRFRDGRLDGAARPADRADCHVGADPVAFLLVAYGRQSQWRAIAAGKMVAWGRRPWWAFRLTRLLVTP